VFCLPVLYVLSSGPVLTYEVAYFQQNGPTGTNFLLEDIYGPLWEFADSDLAAAKPFRTYLNGGPAG
jgi:hypothetical protein